MTINMVRCDVPCDAPDAAWPLLVEPDRWHEWAPHVRGAWGLGEPEVELGRSGFVRLAGVVPVPVKIINKGERSWTWQVAGLVTMEHRVEPDAVVITLAAPAPLEQALGVAYGPVIRAMLRRLSRTATAQPRPTRTGSPAG
jgi:hypothetical protein